MILALTLLTYFLFALALTLGVISGFRRGLGRGIVRGVYLLLLIPIACLPATLLAAPISTRLTAIITDSSSSLIQTIVKDSPETVELLFQMARSLTLPILFALFYGVLELLSLICFKRVSTWTVKKAAGEKQNRHSGLFGGMLGLLQGVLVSTILLMPLCMAVTLASNTDPAAFSTPDSASSVQAEKQSDSAVSLLPSSHLLKSATLIPTDKIPEAYTELRKNKICMMTEAPYIINAVGYAKQSYASAVDNGEAKSIALIRAVGAINSHSDGSLIIPSVMAIIMNTSSSDFIDMIQQGLGIGEVDNKIALKLIDDVNGAFERATPQNIRSILDTLAGDGKSNGTIEDLVELNANTSSGQTVKQNEELVADILLNFGRNEHLKTSNSSVGVIASEFISSADSPLTSPDTTGDEKKQIFEIVCDEINKRSDTLLNFDSTNYEKAVNDISDTIITETKSFGYELTESEGTIAAIGLIAYVEDGGEISPEGLMEFIGISEKEIDEIFGRITTDTTNP